MSAAVIILRRKKFIRRFREQGATSPDRAISFAAVGMRRSWIFEQMVEAGVFGHVGHDRYYLNEATAEAFMAEKRRKALVVTGVLLVVFVIILLVSAWW